VNRYLSSSVVSVDPFARNKRWATFTNDLSPETLAEYHMEAVDFCNMLAEKGVLVDLALLDPPYSPRQISECYAGVGKKATMQDTQSAFWRKIKDALDPLILPGGVCLSFGWNSQGMGLKRGYSIEELLLVPHGGAHNDTICIAERKAGYDL